MLAMSIFILGFMVGVCWLQWQPQLPSLPVVLLAAILAAAAGLVGGKCLQLRWLGLFSAVLLGFVWAAGWAQVRMADHLAVEDEGRDIRLVGVISNLPQTVADGKTFDFQVERVLDAVTSVPRHLSLAWYPLPARKNHVAVSVPEVHAGERWQLTVRLKRPHGSINPQGHDFEAWLLQNNLRATGYVRSKATFRRLTAFVPGLANWINRLREQIRQRFVKRIADAKISGLLTALAIGDQRAIPATQWQDFRRTGITHLVSISGLHVTMVAGLVHGLVFFFWRHRPAWVLRVPAQRIAAAAGLLAALFYSLLAGFAVPTQRTLYMLAVVAIALWSGRMSSLLDVLALALGVVLLFDPWAVLAPGFWLSFGAVAVLLYIGTGRLGKAHWLRVWGQSQWAMSLMSIPALLVLFQQFSIVSPLANALAIPLVSLIITPLALLATLPGLDFLLQPASWLVQLLLYFIETLSAWSLASWQQQSPPDWAWLLGLAGGLWLLLPAGFPARWLGVVALLPAVLVLPPRPAPGSSWLTVLDVGQGLAVHVQTARHDLLYDTGPRYSETATAAERVLLPYLQAQGVERLQGVIISHSDMDHSGGIQVLLRNLPIDWLLSSYSEARLPASNPVERLRCQSGQSWTWDGVHFEILHPQAEQYDWSRQKTNDLSCALKITTDNGRVLIAGDIEARSERALLASRPESLAAEVLIAPHHGSKTSSTAEFIQAVGAQHVIFTVGYRNRFGHPHPAVIERYQASGARLWRSDESGALHLRPTAENTTAAQKMGLSVEAERSLKPRYWYGR